MTDQELAALKNGQAKPAKADLTITVRATLDGFPIEIVYTGSIDQLLATTKRLRELGAEPVSPPVSPIGDKPARKAERVEPVYQPDGTPCCPKHKKPLKDGKWGMFCPAKDDSTERGYCALKFVEDV